MKAVVTREISDSIRHTWTFSLSTGSIGASFIRLTEWAYQVRATKRHKWRDADCWRINGRGINFYQQNPSHILVPDDVMAEAVDNLCAQTRACIIYLPGRD